jgi:hypothetical protein
MLLSTALPEPTHHLHRWEWIDRRRSTIRESDEFLQQMIACGGDLEKGHVPEKPLLEPEKSKVDQGRNVDRSS